jgi:hypothetical protein
VSCDAVTLGMPARGFKRRILVPFRPGSEI